MRRRQPFALAENGWPRPLRFRAGERSLAQRAGLRPLPVSVAHRDRGSIAAAELEQCLPSRTFSCRMTPPDTRYATAGNVTSHTSVREGPPDLVLVSTWFSHVEARGLPGLRVLPPPPRLVQSADLVRQRGIGLRSCRAGEPAVARRVDGRRARGPGHSRLRASGRDGRNRER